MFKPRLHSIRSGDKTGIKKHCFHRSEDTIREHPILLDHDDQPSLGARQAMLASPVPELAAAAAGDVTDLVVRTYSGAHIPGADICLASLLGLRPSVRCTALCLQGCTAGSAVLRVAKDVAENNPGARVLAACADLTLVMFRTPDEEDWRRPTTRGRSSCSPCSPMAPAPSSWAPGPRSPSRSRSTRWCRPRSPSRGMPAWTSARPVACQRWCGRTSKRC